MGSIPATLIFLGKYGKSTVKRTKKIGRYSSIGRMLDCESGGWGFEPPYLPLSFVKYWLSRFKEFFEFQLQDARRIMRKERRECKENWERFLRDWDRGYIDPEVLEILCYCFMITLAIIIYVALTLTSVVGLVKNLLISIFKKDAAAVRYNFWELIKSLFFLCFSFVMGFYAFYG